MNPRSRPDTRQLQQMNTFAAMLDDSHPSLADARALAAQLD
jgi:hypothetical protein